MKRLILFFAFIFASQFLVAQSHFSFTNYEYFELKSLLEYFDFGSPEYGKKVDEVHTRLGKPDHIFNNEDFDIHFYAEHGVGPILEKKYGVFGGVTVIPKAPGTTEGYYNGAYPLPFKNSLKVSDVLSYYGQPEEKDHQQGTNIYYYLDKGFLFHTEDDVNINLIMFYLTFDWKD